MSDWNMAPTVRYATYDEHESGTWRKQVENCTITGCALYEVLPKAGYGKKAAKLAKKQMKEATT